MARSYYPRIADGELRSRPDRMGAVLIEGPRGCGKTETASQMAASQVRLDLDPTMRDTGMTAQLNWLGFGARPLVWETRHPRGLGPHHQ
jgi:ATP-dependent Clp protease ATP-binding subunit ClpA